MKRPKVLGGQYTNKMTEKAQSTVKEFLSGQTRNPDQDHCEIVENYYRNKMRLRNNLDNIYKSKCGSPNRRQRDKKEELQLPVIEQQSAQKIAAAQEFGVIPRPPLSGHVSIKKQLE